MNLTQALDGKYPIGWQWWIDRNKLPDIPAIYMVCSIDNGGEIGQVRYVGKTYRLKNRFYSHHKSHRFAQFYQCFIVYQPLPLKYLNGDIEQQYIEHLKPDLNGQSVYE